MSPQVTAAAKAEMLRLRRQSLMTIDGAAQTAAVSPLQVWLDFIPGGCATHQYQLSFSGESGEGDRAIDCDGLNLVVRVTAWPHVQQLTLDYSEDLMGGSFRFDNPALAATCNCGQSFSLPPTNLD